MPKKTLIELAKEYDFETEQEYYDYIEQTAINGQPQQVRKLFNQMLFLNKAIFLDNNMSIWNESVDYLKSCAVCYIINNDINL